MFWPVLTNYSFFTIFFISRVLTCKHCTNSVSEVFNSVYLRFVLAAPPSGSLPWQAPTVIERWRCGVASRGCAYNRSTSRHPPMTFPLTSTWSRVSRPASISAPTISFSQTSGARPVSSSVRISYENVNASVPVTNLLFPLFELEPGVNLPAIYIFLCVTRSRCLNIISCKQSQLYYVGSF